VNLTINGVRHTVDDGLTLADLLARWPVKGPVATEVNGELIARRQRDSHALREGDVVRIVPIPPGG